MKLAFSWFCCLLLLAPWAAQAQGSAAAKDLALRRALMDLKSDVRVMCIAAHPDDDDYDALAWFRYQHGCYTYDVQVTRGEGGQNEIGPELYDKLAVIRDAESRRAAERVDAVYYNLALPDFGYSKTADETLEKWGREAALEKFVWILRLCRPHVIITHHGLRQDHGHHQATGILIKEAFDAASDPQQFPGQLSEWIEPWQATKLYVRTWEGEGDARVPVGNTAPFTTTTFEEIGARALQEHHSQGVWPEPKKNPEPHQYLLVKSAGDVPAADFLAGVDDESSSPMASIRAAMSQRNLETLLAESAGNLPSMIRTQLERSRHMDPGMEPEAPYSARSLAMDRAIAQTLDYKVTLADDVMVCDDASGLVLPGLRLENLVTPPRVFVARGRQAQVFAERLEARRAATPPVEATCMTNLPLHEHVDDYALGAYQVFVHATANTPQNKNLMVTEDFLVNAAPPVLVEVDPEVTVAVPCAGECKSVTVTANLTRYAENVDAVRVEFQGPPGWPNLSPLQTVSFEGTEPGESKPVSFVLHAAGITGDREHPVTIRAYHNNELIHSDTGIVRAMDIKTPADLKVGVVKSYDDTLERALSHLHVDYELIDEAQLRRGNLSRFDTICLDIRAYAKREDLVENNERILDYARNGGHVVCFYNKTFEWNPEFAPYPLQLSRKRVTRETADITVLAPDHALLNRPNPITDAAWEGWIQERGLYFPDQWADEYTALLASHDPGEAPLEGGYLFANYGAGSYLYTSYVWYRQLREGHTGAYKAFANMIAWPLAGNHVGAHE